MNKLKLTDCHQVLEAFDANLANSTFREVSLAEISVSFTTMERSNFDNVHLSGAQFEDCAFTGATLRRCSYEGMTIEDISVEAMLAAYRSSMATNAG